MMKPPPDPANEPDPTWDPFQWLTINEAAEYANVTSRTIWRWMRDGKVVSVLRPAGNDHMRLIRQDTLPKTPRQGGRGRPSLASKQLALRDPDIQQPMVGYVLSRLASGRREFLATETVSPFADVTLTRGWLLDREDPQWAKENPIHRMFHCRLEVGAEIHRSRWPGNSVPDPKESPDLEEEVDAAEDDAIE